MKGFKLIGITPLNSCDSMFRKNLEIGKTYQFYSDYFLETQIKDNDIEITFAKSDPENKVNIYELKNGINLNISAVVGKNGTGKSSILEMLYYTIYAISTDKKNGDRKILNTELGDLKDKLNEAQEYYFWFDNCYQVKLKLDEKQDLNKFEREVFEHDYKDPFLIAVEVQKKYKPHINETKITDADSFVRVIKSYLQDNIIRILMSDIEEEEKWENFFRSNFACSVLYESDGVIKEISYQESSFTFSEFIPEKVEKTIDINEFDFSDFFYSISLNFSHHSLNSRSLGKWINKLFHKNDAYITPVVINPMRNAGNFEINHELNLSKERLMANVLFDLTRKKKSLLLGKYKIAKFIFSPKILSGLPAFDYTEKFISDLQSAHLFKEVLKIKKLDDRIEYWEFAIGYLERKITRISEKYGFLFFESNSNLSRQQQLNSFLINDKSHITKKIRQVLNFLRITHLQKNRSFWQIPEGTVKTELNEEEMLEWLKLFKIDFKTHSPSDLIELGLPGFFNIDFLLKDQDENEIEFSKLSSGEQQMILNTNSILYHLINLESVHLNPIKADASKAKRVEYKNINIILDEVELYYHPEMQRRLVSELINNFERVKLKCSKGIQSINVCILTHSPFVLSDIPSSNVLSLNKKQDKNNNQTFGANIHDILLENFFMDSVTGEFVKGQIDEILRFYNKVRFENTSEGIRKLRKQYKKKLEKYRYYKNNIGEDVLRGIISNHIDFIEEKLNEKD